MDNIGINEALLLKENQDGLIQQEINRKLNAVTTWDTRDVQVKVKNAAAELSGTVENTKALEQTVLVVFTVRGLRQIDNKLSIRKEGSSSFSNHTSAGIDTLTNEKDNGK